MSFRLTRKVTLERLQAEYGFDAIRAERIIEIAIEFGIKGEATHDGIVTVRCIRGDKAWRFEIEPPRNRRKRAGSVASTRNAEYPSSRPIPPPMTSRTGGEIMPPRGRTKVAEPAEVEEEIEEAPEKDFTAYREKNLTPTMRDFTTWIIDNVYEGDEDAFGKTEPERLVALGPTLYHDFQRSDFNKEQKAARKAERAAGNGAPEEEAEETEETPKPARTTRTAGKAPAKAAPARRGRGRATAGASAPY